MPPSLLALVVAPVVCVLLTSCGQQPGTGAVANETPSPTAAPGQGPARALAGVPELDPGSAGSERELFHFLADDGSVVGRAPWSACLSNGCWDGAPHLAGGVPSVGSPDALWFAFAHSGWDFEHVSFNPVGDPCGGRVIEVAAEKVGDRLFRIRPAGLSGTWRVDVFGRGRDGGDAVASVLWSTKTDGSMPSPRATASLFYDEDGSRVTYSGPAVGISDLAATPRAVSGSWTVSDPSGTSVTVPLSREKSRCEREGTVSLSGPELTDEQDAYLRGRTMTYTVELQLDEVTYTGTANWSHVPSAPAQPELELTFDPPLPAYTG